MSQQGPPPPPPPPPPPYRRGQQGDGGPGGPNNQRNRPPVRVDQGWPKWSLWILVALFALVVVLTTTFRSGSSHSISYTAFLSKVKDKQVQEITYNNANGHISGKLKDGSSFSTTGFVPFPTADRTLLQNNGVTVKPTSPSSSWVDSILPVILIIGGLGLLFWWLQRRAAGQMTGIMSIGRSRAKTYSTERPSTTFADVAGYDQVKQEIREVVDFLRYPEKFGQIGARIPKGVLLVGPPGTGKTLIARAVAGEAGVPFLSVTGSDFMEMFVGVGASRVRDLFQSARKLGRAIIFVDEVDSIGRKRGAGLGGGHDEREQTLNQMLAEMDGFEPTEGIVMMAATNRPDILDPALLRPGRFDRQVVVPLPEIDERRAILEVHCKGKRIASDVDLTVVSRGTPGMSGADLSNLVNEAALHAVRNGRLDITMDDFEYARDRVLMGQQRDSMALSDREKEVIAYHEAGHATCAAVLETTDPVHKVTILPAGMALGVTQQLPDEERHIYRQDYIEESIVVAMGGRCSEELVFGVISTGANNDLVTSTERARKMVREWGMSHRIGPMAWGSNNQVFLGEDLMHTAREYSDETARVIDEEVEQILRRCEDRCRALLREHRRGLDAVAHALVEHETISGAEVLRLIREAAGQAVDGHVSDEQVASADMAAVPGGPDHLSTNGASDEHHDEPGAEPQESRTEQPAATEQTRDDAGNPVDHTATADPTEVAAPSDPTPPNHVVDPTRVVEPRRD